MLDSIVHRNPPPNEPEPDLLRSGSYRPTVSYGRLIRISQPKPLAAVETQTSFSKVTVVDGVAQDNQSPAGWLAGKNKHQSVNSLD
jgi:hypothetical protein